MTEKAILTNTFGGTSIKLAASGLVDRAREINRAGAALARAAGSDNIFVVGDIGPTGKLLEPYGELTEADLRSSFEEQIKALLAGGVDALIFEMQMDLREAVIGVQAAQSLTPLPVIVSFTFNKTRRGFFTLMGNSVREAIHGAEDAAADIVGTNCSLDSHEMKYLVKEINAAIDWRLLWHKSGIYYGSSSAPVRTYSLTIVNGSSDIWKHLNDPQNINRYSRNTG